jgi:hypothetical protein
MIPAREDSDLPFCNLIDESMFLVDLPRPAAFQLVLQGLWFSNPLEGVTLHVFYQINDTQRLAAILLNPPG